MQTSEPREAPGFNVARADAAEHWRAIFAGALISIGGCARCAGAPSLKCRRCRVDLAMAGLSAFHMVNDVDPDERARGAL